MTMINKARQRRIAHKLRIEGDKKNFGHDLDTHHLISLKQPPPSMIALRNELALPSNKDIYDEAIKGKNIEESLGTVAARLDILLDGTYDMEALCNVLMTALKSRYGYKNQPHLRDSRLVSAEIVERKEELTVERVETDIATITSPSGDAFATCLNCGSPSICAKQRECNFNRMFSGAKQVAAKQFLICSKHAEHYTCITDGQCVLGITAEADTKNQSTTSSEYPAEVENQELGSDHPEKDCHQQELD